MILLFSTAWALELSYADAMRQASERNAAVAEADTTIDAAEATLLSARGPFDPTLSASTGWYGSNQEQTFFGFSTSDATRSWDFNVALSQYMITGTRVSLSMGASSLRYLSFETALSDDLPPPSWSTDLRLELSQSLLEGLRPSSNSLGIRTAKRSLSIAEARKLAQRQQALSETASAYWELWYQRQLVRIAESSLKVVQEQERVVRALVQDGRLALVEQTRVEAAVADAQRSLLDAQLAEATAADSLLLLLGERPGQTVELSSSPPPLPESLPDLESITESVRQGSPDLLALRIQLEDARFRLSDARHRLLPNLDATASYGISGYEESLGKSFEELGSADLGSWTVGAALNVPLLNRADRGSVGQMEAEVARLEIQVRSLEDSLDQQARSLMSRIRAARQRMELSELDLRLRRETLRAEQARLEEGRALQKDVLAAIADLERAEIQAQRAQIDHLQAWQNLQRLRGALDTD